MSKRRNPTVGNVLRDIATAEEWDDHVVIAGVVIGDGDAKQLVICQSTVETVIASWASLSAQVLEGLEESQDIPRDSLLLAMLSALASACAKRDTEPTKFGSDNGP